MRKLLEFKMTEGTSQPVVSFSIRADENNIFPVIVAFKQFLKTCGYSRPCILRHLEAQGIVIMEK